ncbi:MAG TPA: hypothetical protein VGB26_15805 [Nitrospiria bacterium]|jgi:prephenate dehydratase
MADRIKKVDYFKIQVPNRPGVGAKILGDFKKEKINLLGFSGFPRGGKSQLDLIPQNTKAFLSTAKRLKVKVGAKKTGFLAQGQDRVGAIASIMEKLSAAKINVTAIDAICAGKGRYGAIFWVKGPNMAKASKVLKATQL